jgi:4-hydroxy-4-methyl-2-oxoglutarate aldolase
MNRRDLQQMLLTLSTPLIADACMREGVPVHGAPAGIKSLWPGAKAAGGARPARHFGSVDVFLETLESAQAGDVLVIDNAGRTDEACVGDLIALEAKTAGLSGIVIWGLSRDTDEIVEVKFPLFSLGSIALAPQRNDPQPADALEFAVCGDCRVTTDDYVMADDSGVIFVPTRDIERIAHLGAEIQAAERIQAARMRQGISFRQQTRFDAYLRERSTTPALSFREHLRRLGDATG